MRRVRVFLVLLLLISFQIANALSLFQARGLQKLHCYNEMASLTCKKSCTLNLLPLTAAEISLNVHSISKKDRQTLGHFFEVRFKVLNEEANEIQIVSLKDVANDRFKSTIEKSNRLFAPQSCSNK